MATINKLYNVLESNEYCEKKIKQKKENQECWAVVILKRVKVGLIEKLTFSKNLKDIWFKCFSQRGRPVQSRSLPALFEQTRGGQCVCSSVSHEEEW